jgi:hypothetical protein
VCKDAYQPGEQIVVQVVPTGVPDGAIIRGSLSVSGKSSVWQPDANKHEYGIWGDSSKHSITAKGMWVKTDTGKLGGALQDFGWYEYYKDITIGPEVPVPDPFPPKPEPQPKPGGPYQILFLYDQQQLDNMPTLQRAILTSLEHQQALSSLGHRVVGVLAAQAVNPASTKYKAYLDAAKDVPLPLVAYMPLAGGKVQCVTLPPTYGELVKLLDKVTAQ